jgi:hypothetical protein
MFTETEATTHNCADSEPPPMRAFMPLVAPTDSDNVIHIHETGAAIPIPTTFKGTTSRVHHGNNVFIFLYGKDAIPLSEIGKWQIHPQDAIVHRDFVIGVCTRPDYVLPYCIGSAYCPTTGLICDHPDSVKHPHVVHILSLTASDGVHKRSTSSTP